MVKIVSEACSAVCRVNPKETQEQQELNEARDVLLDPDGRKAYDRSLALEAGAGSSGSGIVDLFARSKGFSGFREAFFSGKSSEGEEVLSILDKATGLRSTPEERAEKCKEAENSMFRHPKSFGGRFEKIHDWRGRFWA